MSEATPSTAGRIATGAAIGMIAGLAASFAMDRFQALTQPKSDDNSEPATEQAADGIARDVTGEPLADKDKPLGGQLVHYGLGTLLGIGYGIARELADLGASVFLHHYSPHDADQPWGADDLDAVLAGVRTALHGDAVSGAAGAP